MPVHTRQNRVFSGFSYLYNNKYFSDTPIAAFLLVTALPA